eukprot:2840964-Alexandrium_andersonii.AAC.1
MSASLVGSEMCIRDRVSAPLQLRLVQLDDEVQVRPRAPQPVLHFRQVHPVSYTHLTLPTICSV